MLIAGVTCIGFLIGALASLVGGLVMRRWDGGHAFAFGLIWSVVSLGLSFFLGWYALAVMGSLAVIWVVYVVVAVSLDHDAQALSANRSEREPVGQATEYRPLFTNIPTDRQECWRRLEKFAHFWHGSSCSPVDYSREIAETEARLRIKLPPAVVEWYSRFGRFMNDWCDRAVTVPIDQLQIEDGKLILRSESVFGGMIEAKWGIPLWDLDSDDPEVVATLGLDDYACADRVSQFAIFCAVFDSINSWLMEDLAPDNAVPFPAGGAKMEFPASFGMIDTEMHEGNNWIAMISGRDWYLRRRRSRPGADEFVKHEVRTPKDSAD